MISAGMMSQVGSVLASAMFVWAMFRQYFPYELRGPMEKYLQKLINLVYPYVQITFHEYRGDYFQRNRAYTAIERYLGVHSSMQAKRLKADVSKNSQSLVLSIDDYEETTDEFEGVKVWWSSRKNTPLKQSFSFYPSMDEKRYYTITFHKKHRDLVTKTYLNHLLEEAKEIEVRSRQRKLYTNNKSEGYGYRRSMWSHIVFDHPASFDTLAMDPVKKREIINDLVTFSNAKDYYRKIGKAWKRGYLLYGPPGTGKSSMIAAMANLLNYDVYDLELTAVKDNTELRKLLIDTSTKSIIVIEDIDCSLDLTGQRKKKTDEEEKEEEKTEKDEKEKIKKKLKEEDESKSKVTLSGLLNFIDGLWSACGSERLIVFTTNYVEKLDPALIRRGRMDKRVELSYCGFEAFKILAKNYHDLEDHPLFETIKGLLEETKMTPADVGENLMPKSAEDNSEICLRNLIAALEDAKEEERLSKAKKEEEERIKAEKEAKEKAKKEEEEEAERIKAEKEAKQQENGDAEEEVKSSKKTVVDGKKENGSIEDVKENGNSH